MDENNPRIKEHCAEGGFAAVFENGYVSILKGSWKIRIHKVTEIPITYGGKAIHNIMNTLPAVLAAYLYSTTTIDDVKQALRTFIPSEVQTPGRLNLFQFKKFQMLLDFAHNPAGLRLLGEFIKRMDASPKIGIISGTGDRRDEDIREIGRISAEYFDEIIIRQDKYLRGRSAEEIVDLLKEGIDQGKPKEVPVTIILKERDAILHAYQHASPGSLITLLADKVDASLELIKQLKEEEEAI